MLPRPRWTRGCLFYLGGRTLQAILAQGHQQAAATFGIVLLIDKFIDTDPNKALALSAGSSALLDPELPRKAATHRSPVSINSQPGAIGRRKIDLFLIRYRLGLRRPAGPRHLQAAQPPRDVPMAFADAVMS